MENNLFAIAF